MISYPIVRYLVCQNDFTEFVNIYNLLSPGTDDIGRYHIGPAIREVSRCRAKGSQRLQGEGSDENGRPTHELSYQRDDAVKAAACRRRERRVRQSGNQ